MPFAPGQSGNPNGREIGSKNKVTLAKEERRAIFEEATAKKWLDVIDKLRPEYVADQYMGKAPEENNVHIDGVIVTDAKKLEIAQKYEKEIKEGL